MVVPAGEHPQPAQSVDIGEPKLDHVESRGAGAMGLVPTAALVFGALVWLSLPIGFGMGISETEAIEISWLAIFPTVFGLVARSLRKSLLAQNKPAVLVPFGAGAAAGLGAVLLLAFFYVAIWPSL